jgi:hypothetical protein
VANPSVRPAVIARCSCVWEAVRTRARAPNRRRASSALRPTRATSGSVNVTQGIRSWSTVRRSPNSAFCTTVEPWLLAVWVNGSSIVTSPPA